MLATKAKSYPLSYLADWNLIFPPPISHPYPPLHSWQHDALERESVPFGIWQTEIQITSLLLTFTTVTTDNALAFLPPWLSHPYLGHLNSESRWALFPSHSLPSPHLLEGWTLFLPATLFIQNPWNHSHPVFQSVAPTLLPSPSNAESGPGLGLYFNAQNSSWTDGFSSHCLRSYQL